MKRIAVTFKSGRYVAFDLSEKQYVEISTKILNAQGQIQLLVFDSIILNLYEVESIVAKDIKKEQNDDTAT